MTNRDFLFENRRVRSVLHVNHAVVLEVRAIADADEMNVAAHGAIAPDRSLFAEMHVADHLSAWIHVRGWVNLRVHPTKRSNHDFADSNTLILLIRAYRCAKLLA